MSGSTRLLVKMKHGTMGMGWRQPHYDAVLAGEVGASDVDFLEVHSENFFAEGGASLQVLLAGRERLPLSLHGVGLGLGSACGLDPWHLDRLADLVERVDPLLVSDHAAFTRAPWNGAQQSLMHAADLLPIPFDRASLDLMIGHVQQVQERLRRPILVENLSAYLAWQADGASALSEPEFFNELCRRSGCRMLLDVNNLVVNARNSGAPPDEAARRAIAWVQEIAVDSVGEIHLAGHLELPGVVIDDHGSRVSEAVWQVYRAAIERFGPVPSLVEWDNDIPDLSVLLGEVARARQEMRILCP
ncbi:DUF692 domain-containing protein [Kinneretia aquatilis]|uniref:DUF692 domain-containing protein n=1 Tax=Kinneretia aquatilis TaxID=2070761 RepID=UPI001CC0A45F|nr:DUF692 domain-containing protein [Paucibacter aquatile]WIV99944.1 DUF692 domain-containing protein [Paucibacter aquatile]